MKPDRIPQTDSIAELTRFWDSHDLTDFEGELEEVTEPVFEREPTVRLRLDSQEAAAVQRMAQSRGLTDADLIHQWVQEKIAGA